MQWHSVHPKGSPLQWSEIMIQDLDIMQAFIKSITIDSSSAFMCSKVLRSHLEIFNYPIHFSFNLTQQWVLWHPCGGPIHHPHKHRCLQANSQTSCVWQGLRHTNNYLPATGKHCIVDPSTSSLNTVCRATPISCLSGLRNFFWVLFHASVQFGLDVLRVILLGEKQEEHRVFGDIETCFLLLFFFLERRNQGY